MAEFFSPAVPILSKNTGVKRKRPTEKVPPTVRAVLANLNLPVIAVPARDVPEPRSRPLAVAARGGPDPDLARERERKPSARVEVRAGADTPMQSANPPP